MGFREIRRKKVTNSAASACRRAHTCMCMCVLHGDVRAVNEMCATRYSVESTAQKRDDAAVCSS